MYNIIRFYQNKGPRVIKRGVTLEEAQAHCNDDSTHGPGWFDGYQSA